MAGIWFKVQNWSTKISAITVDKHTDVSIFVDGRRRNRVGSYESYYQTFDEAKTFLLTRLKNERDAAKQRAERAERDIITMLALTEDQINSDE